MKVPAIPALILMCLATSCFGGRRAAVPVSASISKSVSPDFVDLQPGWQVRVVIPMLRSGGYVVPSVKSHSDGNTVVIETGDDFLGYEKAYYRVTARREGGVRVRFAQAEVWQNGRTRKWNTTRLALFEPAANARYVRLVYLIRVSSADHNMAIVASTNQSALEELTRTVVSSGSCRNSSDATCTWVPEGIAVTPEKR